ncbi:hypothetical protein [Levilactobacillus brevis]|uniref:hypothetical protein n=1 Tax=Levilactobacillus brevis TaxID=1580 RepID=UPI000572F3A9|nr:hypothetical protein [Levilactobacillus brevis]AJA81602.1 hypothetical protein L747_00675 [Levilactobacillus brevis BSO 464]
MDLEQEEMQKKYYAIPSYEEVKLAMNSELTDEQIRTAGIIIKNAVIYNSCDVHIDLIDFTPGQAYSMLEVLKAKGYSDCNIMFTDGEPDYLTVHLNTSNLRSKE